VTPVNVIPPGDRVNPREVSVEKFDRTAASPPACRRMDYQENVGSLFFSLAARAKRA
jgi:hypothetical protein